MFADTQMKQNSNHLYFNESNFFFVFTGIHLTGMYTNPANATAQTFGCNGSHALEHITVYWLGPFSGTYLAHRIHTYFEFFSIREKIFETPLVAAVDPRPILKVVEQLPEEHVTEIVA